VLSGANRRPDRPTQGSNDHEPDDEAGLEHGSSEPVPRGGLALRELALRTPRGSGRGPRGRAGGLVHLRQPEGGVVKVTYPIMFTPGG